MQTNEISAKTLNTDAQSWIEKLRQVLLIQDKGKGTVKNSANSSNKRNFSIVT